jgi:hypothetical protein
MKTNVAEAYTFLMQHWQPGEGFANSRTHPVVSGTGIKRGKKLCERAIPAGFRVIGRRRRDRLPRLLVLTANQRHGRMRASIGEDLVGPVLKSRRAATVHARLDWTRRKKVTIGVTAKQPTRLIARPASKAVVGLFQVFSRIGYITLEQA